MLEEAIQEEEVLQPAKMAKFEQPEQFSFKDTEREDWLAVFMEYIHCQKITRNRKQASQLLALLHRSQGGQEVIQIIQLW